MRLQSSVIRSSPSRIFPVPLLLDVILDIIKTPFSKLYNAEGNKSTNKNVFVSFQLFPQCFQHIFIEIVERIFGNKMRILFSITIIEHGDL